MWSTKDSWSRRRRVVAKAEWTTQGANPRFIVTSLKPGRWAARALYEDLYCARGDMENRIKECQLDLYADRTSANTMRANQLRLWFASFAYVLICALRRLGLAHTRLANATCGTIRLKLLKIGAQVRVSVRRIKGRDGFGVSLCRRICSGSRPNTCRGPLTPQDLNLTVNKQRIHCKAPIVAHRGAGCARLRGRGAMPAPWPGQNAA